MEKPFWKQKNSSYYLEKLKLLIKFCGLHKIKFIVLPLVDNSSIKNDNLKKKLFLSLKNFVIYLQKK